MVWIETYGFASFVGFLLGASLAGAVGWKFLADEYRLTNEALNLDIRVCHAGGLDWLVADL